MSSNILNLQKSSINLYIDPINTIGHLAPIDTVIKVLQRVSLSYNQFVIHEFLKTEQFKKAYTRDHKILARFSEDMRLYVTDVSLSSFAASVAPNVIESNESIFKNEVRDWKIEKFEQYKSDFIYADYTKVNTLKSLSKKYSKEERRAIIIPLLSAVSPGNYNLRINDIDGKIKNTIVAPHKDYAKILIPPKVRGESLQNSKIIQAYFKISSTDGGIKLNKSNIQEVYDIQVLDHDTYPYRPEIIKNEDEVFVLNEKLQCAVTFEDGLYYIFSEQLDITVWGETREIVESAFCFAFASLYENFAKEKDALLSDNAKRLKQKINSLISKQYHESKKGKRP